MHFKIVMLTVIRNKSKRTISSSGELKLIQLVSESITRLCVTLIGVGLYHFHSKCILKIVRLTTIHNMQKLIISTSSGYI